MNLNINNRMATSAIVYVRNPAKAGAIFEMVNGERSLIEAGRIGAIEEARLPALGKLVEKSDKKAFDAQSAADEKADLARIAALKGG